MFRGTHRQSITLTGPIENTWQVQQSAPTTPSAQNWTSNQSRRARVIRNHRAQTKLCWGWTQVGEELDMIIGLMDVARCPEHVPGRTLCASSLYGWWIARVCFAGSTFILAAYERNWPPFEFGARSHAPHLLSSGHGIQNVPIISRKSRVYYFFSLKCRRHSQMSTTSISM